MSDDPKIEVCFNSDTGEIETMPVAELHDEIHSTAMVAFGMLCDGAAFATEPGREPTALHVDDVAKMLKHISANLAQIFAGRVLAKGE